MMFQEFMKQQEQKTEKKEAKANETPQVRFTIGESEIMTDSAKGKDTSQPSEAKVPGTDASDEAGGRQENNYKRIELGGSPIAVSVNF